MSGIKGMKKKNRYKIKDTSNMKGTHPKSEFKKGRTPWNKDKEGLQKHSEATRKKMSQSHPKGKYHPNWKGGITPFLKRVRNSMEYKMWRIAVFTRDNWMCQNCGKRNGKNVGKTVCINAHHILNFAEYPELRFAIDNGITLCKKCHLKFHKKYGFKNNTKEQLNEFLRTGDAPTANTTTIGSLFVKYTA